jgi:uncharacterized protein (DUF697 family)
MSVDVELDREAEARSIVRRYSFGNAAVGLIPVPIFDLVALTGVQLKMVHSLANHYGVKFNKDIVKSSLISLAGSLGSMTVGAGIILSALKFVPALALTAGAFALPACSAAFTYAVGRAFIMHFEAGGNVLNFDAEAMHKYFKEFYQEGLAQTKGKADEPEKKEPVAAVKEAKK